MKEWTTVAKQRWGPNKNVTLSYGSTKLLLSPGILGEAETVGRMCPPPRDRPVVQPPGSLPTRLGNSDSHPWCRPFKSQEHSVGAGVGGVLRVTAMSPARAASPPPDRPLTAEAAASLSSALTRQGSQDFQNLLRLTIFSIVPLS